MKKKEIIKEQVINHEHGQVKASLYRELVHPTRWHKDDYYMYGVECDVPRYNFYGKKEEDAVKHFKELPAEVRYDFKTRVITNYEYEDLLARLKSVENMASSASYACYGD